MDSISLYATILVNKEASNDNMLVIDANCMPEGATELILTGYVRATADSGAELAGDPKRKG